jgi:hypothetical protein
MRTHIQKLSVGISLGVVVVAGTTWLPSAVSSSGGPDATEPTTRTASSRETMVDVLSAPGPNTALGEEARTFDRLVGTWEAEFTFRRGDGTLLHKKGELHFGWVMDGRAIQDLWIGYPAEGRPERTIGTTIRFFDTKLHQWRIVFINPQSNYIVNAQGGREGDRIVFRGLDIDGFVLRWTFSDITGDTFHWQGEKSHDGGASWTLEEDHQMKRRGI